jgi:ABC-2 type transport system ATP-binding protein
MGEREQLISVEDATLTFTPGTGLFDVGFELTAGKILGVIGPSGCGKTTLVRLLNGLYPPDAGRVRVLGKNPLVFTPADREKIGYMPQQFVLYPNLTVQENIYFVASLYGVKSFRRSRKLKTLLEFVELSDARKRLARHLSGGMQRRLLLAAMLMHDPTLLYCDEPTAGIDPILRRRFWEHFRTLCDEGRTLLITTQYVGEASYCDLVALMYRGRLIHVDTPEALRRKAIGGEAIMLRVNQATVREAIRALQHPLIHDVKRDDGEPGTDNRLCRRCRRKAADRLSDPPATSRSRDLLGRRTQPALRRSLHPPGT